MAEGALVRPGRPGFENGWRWMYAVGALLALIAIALRVQLPESPRWLLGRGRVGEADAVVADMERTASRHGPLPEPGEVEEEIHTHDHMPYRYVLGHGVYLRRVILLVLVWFIGYVTVYCFSP